MIERSRKRLQQQSVENPVRERWDAAMNTEVSTTRVLDAMTKRARHPTDWVSNPVQSPGRFRTAFTDFCTRFAQRRSRGEFVNTEQEIFSADTPPDVTSVRAKSSRHGKSTADKWNQ
jgi:hypothetical protein